jgi:hypothetical protein
LISKKLGTDEKSCHVGAPAPVLTRACPAVPVVENANAVPVPYATAPAVGVEVEFVPPLAIGKVPVVRSEVDVA